MLRLLTPRLLIIAAIVTSSVGIAALYAGYPRLGSVGLFAGILATIMTAIMITTPEAAVEAGYARLAAESAASHSSTPASTSGLAEQPASQQTDETVADSAPE